MPEHVTLKPYLADVDNRSDEMKLEARAKLKALYDQNKVYWRDLMCYKTFPWEWIWKRHPDAPFDYIQMRTPYPLRRTPPLPPYMFDYRHNRKFDDDDKE